MRLEMSHPAVGSVPQVANPIRLSATPVAYGLPPPMLGEHTADVLRNVFGLSDLSHPLISKLIVSGDIGRGARALCAEEH
jgi:crotonobetainyl-CoA:carnitine CoA-transferase CaiB-like acyl-CoA transferase